MSTPADRVWGRLSPQARHTLEQELSPTDLQSLLLDLARTRAAAVDPARVLERWRQDRFVRPAAVDPRRTAALVAELWRLLPADVDGLSLSPVAPLGACSAVGSIDQNRVLSTVRTSEVVSDSTNVLALEAAVRRSRDPAGGPVHLAAVHRLLRQQQFPPGYLPHFELFALVSSDRGRRDAETEIALLERHLGFWGQALTAVLGPAGWTIAYTVIDETLRDPLRSQLLPKLSGEVVEDPQRTRAVGYYRSLALTINARTEAGVQEIGDGGFTAWTARLRSDRKERCLISCVSTERLSVLMPG